MRIEFFRGAIAAFALAAAGTSSASVTFYAGENFTGEEMTIDRAVANFEGIGFNDRARSIIVREGRWEICGDANYKGGCTMLGPGRYSALKTLSGKVSSVRPVDAADGRPGRAKPVDPRAVLYEGKNFAGRSFAVEPGNIVGDFDGTGFNDKASSLRIGSGYWIFCSDSNFHGECRTFGPGEHSRLPSELERKISSGRRISEAYPYTQNPRWDR